MREDVGRFFEGRLHETTMLLKAAYDIAVATGPDVADWVHGRELVFSRSEPGESRGFLRILPLDVLLQLAFPKGKELFDPQKRLRGVPGSQLRLTVRGMGDLDPYARRLVEEAYARDDG
jgi:hypothetical protein